MPSLKDLTTLALAARLLDRPLDGPAVLDLAGQLGEQVDADSNTEAYLAPLLEQYLKALEDSSLAVCSSTVEAGALLEDLASRLTGLEKNIGYASSLLD